MPLLELGETQVELDSGQLWIQLQCLPIGGGSVAIFLLTGKIDSKRGKGRSVGWIAGRYRSPHLARLSPFLLLLEGNGIRGCLGQSESHSGQQKRRNRDLPSILKS